MNGLKPPHLGSEEYERIARLISTHCGLSFDERQKYLIEKRLVRRLAALGLESYGDYLRQLEEDHRKGGDGELALAIQELTNHETYFFRESGQLLAFSQEVLPDLVARGGRQLNVWVAGCSTGEEAYSIAILIAESELIDPDRVMIHASDISLAALKTAREGIYGPKSFRGQGLGRRQEALVHRHFTQPDGLRYAVRSELRRRINFFQLNLLDVSRLGMVARVDALFCRNVIIYFNRESRLRVIDNFWNKTRPGGYLLLGHSETLSGLDERFQLRHLGDQLVYQRPLDGEET